MADYAQGYAEECTFALSDAADRVGLVTDVSWVGEGLYATSTSHNEKVAEDAILAWYTELGDYDYENNTCAPGKSCGQYRQVTFQLIISV